MDKTKYKYTCQYCNSQWELSYRARALDCVNCKDKNVKIEEIKIKDYYGEMNSEEYKYIDWRD